MKGAGISRGIGQPRSIRSARCLPARGAGQVDREALRRQVGRPLGIETGPPKDVEMGVESVSGSSSQWASAPALEGAQM